MRLRTPAQQVPADPLWRRLRGAPGGKRYCGEPATVLHLLTQSIRKTHSRHFLPLPESPESARDFASAGRLHLVSEQTAVRLSKT